jgi:hypothetical protein
MNARPVLAVALAVLFVTAGCQAPANPTTSPAAETTTAADTTTATTTQSETTTSEPEEQNYVSVEGDLDFNVERIYRRVGRMLGVPQEDWPDTTVRVQPAEESGNIGRATTYGFTNLVGIEPQPSEGDDGGVTTGAVARGLSITLFDHPSFNETTKRNVLAHEFVHVLQTQVQPRPAVAELDTRRDRQFLVDTMVEGSAEYVQERYGIRYQNFTLNQTHIPESWKNASAYVRMRIAPYEYGSRYFAMRVDDSSEVGSVYQNPPLTAEQVLHGLAPDSEQAKPLTVAANASGSPLDADSPTTKGELFVRLALSTELNWSRAASASTGWGMDRLVEFGGQGDRAYAWVLRWDDAGEATEFTEAFRDYNATSEEAFRLQSVTDETVVVYGGADYFVANATASGSSGNVTVRAS